MSALTITELLQHLEHQPETLRFADVITSIEAHYHFTAVAFNNNGVDNAGGENQGSCKVLAFAKLHQLSKAQTLACFAEHYFADVLVNPSATNHANIRALLASELGIDGVEFSQVALQEKGR
ncbi:HopJ type III effector protein [Pseudoalteromonas fenneropenaei]|uniref:HopJ type III effector protein n=1 Tax=Pseudoalteromonas fenneropenaei TaxID=1737459 RepID=A0ABV7CG34_9GAMM